MKETTATETTALLPHTPPSTTASAPPATHGPRAALTEAWILLRASLPIVLAYALQNSLQTTSVLVVGRLSPEALATAAFSYMFAMATGWLVALGGTTAIDTLGSASFTGSDDPHALGVILQRAMLVLTLFYVPVVALWVGSAPLFRALGQEEYIARDSARFLAVLAPGGLGYIYFESLKKYLQAQGTFVFRLVSLFSRPHSLPSSASSSVIRPSPTLSSATSPIPASSSA